MVDRLPPKTNLNEGNKPEQVDVANTGAKDYYDGSSKLKISNKQPTF